VCGGHRSGAGLLFRESFLRFVRSPSPETMAI
jgi:hypothetical protein